MQMACGVLLYDEAQRLRRLDFGLPTGFGGLREIPLLPVFGQLGCRHGGSDGFERQRFRHLIRSIFMAPDGESLFERAR
jgi:hypothetical protein